MNINELTKDIHENAVAHGWWDNDFSEGETLQAITATVLLPLELREKIIIKLGEPRSFSDVISLCHSELSEALEEDRKGKGLTETYYREDGKPEGIPSELADCVIRIMDACGHYGIDLEAAILEKHEYNKTRPYKHGKKY